MKVKIKNISKNEIPKYETDGSAGLDLRANLDQTITLKPLQRILVPTGLFIELEKGYEAQIRARSGLAIKNGICLANGIGTIDSDYRGEIKIILINLGDQDFKINSGDRIAQMVITKYEQVEFELVEQLNETERSDGGFGHTGK
ncbi:dUTP diphosphatase [Peptoniphilus obesi]|uniref:dUTP diphosphatase n=1 Tax=Peptoniphilus obesi TaxID=1472765 RepID=UPI0004AF9AB4|nr:dUTP diphosphatase [Peptoniphilus obesi]